MDILYGRVGVSKGIFWMCGGGRKFLTGGLG